MKSAQRIHYREDCTRYFLDTEFMEDGKIIELLSIGIVCDDGREFYAVNSEADHSRANRWVIENVIPYLGTENSMSRVQIRDAILSFVLAGASPPEFWAYFADYDWVLFCQLFGSMINLPEGFPQLCMDLKQLMVELGNPGVPAQTGTEHHALNDARWNWQTFAYLRTLPKTELPARVWELPLREFQAQMPWGANSYSKAMEADPAPHKYYRHDALHVAKTTGKLVYCPMEMDHDPARAVSFRAEDTKRLADLVMFANHMARTHPSGPIDLAAAIRDRIAEKFKKPVEGTPVVAGRPPLLVEVPTVLARLNPPTGAE